MPLEKEITTVPELVDALNKKTPHEGVLDVLKMVNIPNSEYERYYKWNCDHYTRIGLAKTEKFELLITCWEKGQVSPVHNYDSKEAFIHIIHGQLREEKFMRSTVDNHLEKVSSITLGKRDYSYLGGAIGTHRYINAYENRTVAIHLFIPPFGKWTEYDLNTGEEKDHIVEYDAFYAIDKVINV